MTVRVFQITATIGLAFALWVVPSVGTRGQGTLGDRFLHPDHGLVSEQVAADSASLSRADAVVIAAVSRL